jgi:O-antigen/teichoic acid export membrane protein
MNDRIRTHVSRHFNNTWNIVANGKILEVLFRNELYKIATAIMSQGILSVSNFVIGILMAKYAPKTEYGIYVILFSFIGILGGYQGGIINAPLMALVNAKNEGERRRYVSGLSAGKNFLFVPVLILISSAMILYGFINDIQGHYIMEGIILFLVAFLYLSKEFFRTLQFVSMNANAILRIDLANVVPVFIGMALLVHLDAVSSLTGILVLGTGYFAAYLLSKRKNPYDAPVNGESIKQALKENWSHGKWVVLGVTSSLMQDRGYIYIVSALLGLSTLAELSAARLFLMPIGLLAFSSAKIAVAKGSKLVSLEENREYQEFIASFLSVLLIIWFLYFLFVLFASNLFIGFLGGKYSNTQNLIYLWGAFFFVYIVRVLLGTVMVVHREFRKQANSDMFGTALAILSCFVLINIVGRAGAILSLIIGETSTMILYVKMYANIIKKVNR